MLRSMEVWVQKPKLTRLLPKLAGVNASEKIGWSRSSHKIWSFGAKLFRIEEKNHINVNNGKDCTWNSRQGPWCYLLFDVSYPNDLIFKSSQNLKLHRLLFAQPLTCSFLHASLLTSSASTALFFPKWTHRSWAWIFCEKPRQFVIMHSEESFSLISWCWASLCMSLQ